MVIVATGSEVLLQLLGEGKCTTAELSKELGKADEGCVDRLPQLLVQLQEEGMVFRTFDREKKQFVWELKDDYK